VRTGALRYAAQRLALLGVFSCVLFASAGRASWTRGWGYVVAVSVLEILNLSALAWLAPHTLARRGSIGAGVKSFDRWFAIAWLVLGLLTPLIAGLDAVRFGWSALPAGLFAPAAIVLALASLFGTWAMVENEHFEQFVRIQADRGHRVVTTGPYRFVRHPGYLAAVIGALATPPMLGSAWAFAPALGIASLFVARTRLEDETLRHELGGYEAYAQRTRFRLVPFVW